jgi:hypothetical protein
LSSAEASDPIDARIMVLRVEIPQEIGNLLYQIKIVHRLSRAEAIYRAVVLLARQLEAQPQNQEAIDTPMIVVERGGGEMRIVG